MPTLHWAECHYISLSPTYPMWDVENIPTLLQNTKHKYPVNTNTQMQRAECHYISMSPTCVIFQEYFSTIHLILNNIPRIFHLILEKVFYIMEISSQSVEGAGA